MTILLSFFFLSTRQKSDLIFDLSLQPLLVIPKNKNTTGAKFLLSWYNSFEQTQVSFTLLQTHYIRELSYCQVHPSE